jgi:enamine deaminase RidA (YjgF/YER057c/UK114 family)
MPDRQRVSSNSPFESVVGFSRAIRAGNLVFVAGTVGSDANGNFAGGVYEQTRQAIDNVKVALERAGATLQDVVRTRIFVTNMDAFEDAARAHREAFGEVRPASTLVEVSRLVKPEMLVEIEADAVIA